MYNEIKKCTRELKGSGYLFLVTDNNKKLSLLITTNQDSSYLYGLTPLLCIDLWEHAYYLEYQNERNRYVEEILKIENRKIWLKCGGFITIDKTEALTAIDVNTGKYTGSKNPEQTVYKVNEEATIEIAKQLRLRDIGGIIIIDYIDMKDDSHKEKIEKLLKERLKNDRTKTQVEGFTKLDLMEMTRKHVCSHKE